MWWLFLFVEIYTRETEEGEGRGLSEIEREITKRGNFRIFLLLFSLTRRLPSIVFFIVVVFNAALCFVRRRRIEMLWRLNTRGVKFGALI